jgi:hypothetical protein
MTLDQDRELAALIGRKVRLSRGAETHIATVRRPVLLWELRGDKGELHLIQPLDEAKPAKKRRAAKG